MLKSRSGSWPMAMSAGLSFVAISVHVKMADTLGAPIPSANFIWFRAKIGWHEKQYFEWRPGYSRTNDSTISLCVMASESGFKCYHRSGGRQCVVFK